MTWIKLLQFTVLRDALVIFAADPNELLERLSRVMGGGGLRQWQTGGRLDPFDSGTSEAWAR
jgi:hypothetical protein